MITGHILMIRGISKFCIYFICVEIVRSYQLTYWGLQPWACLNWPYLPKRQQIRFFSELTLASFTNDLPALRLLLFLQVLASKIKLMNTDNLMCVCQYKYQQRQHFECIIVKCVIAWIRSEHVNVCCTPTTQIALIWARKTILQSYFRTVQNNACFS